MRRCFRPFFNVPEQITVPRWPVHSRYGSLAGLGNPAFLDASLFAEGLLGPLDSWREQFGVLIFEFGNVGRACGNSLKRWTLFTCCRACGGFGMEVRNAEFLSPDCFACLRAHNVSHV
jgi:hypothetical protein